MLKLWFSVCFTFLIIGNFSALAQNPVWERFNQISITAYNNGEHEKAIMYAEKAKALAESASNDTVAARSLRQIALSQSWLKSYEKAEKNYRQAAALFEKNQNDLEKARTLLNLAALKRSQNKFDESVALSLEAIKVNSTKEIQAGHFLNVGIIFYLKQFYVSALIWLEKAEFLIVNDPVSVTLLDAYRYLFHVWSNLGGNAQALRSVNELIRLTKENTYPFKHRQAVILLSDIYNSIGREREAINLLIAVLPEATKDHDLYHQNLLAIGLATNYIFHHDPASAAKYLRLISENELQTNERYSGIYFNYQAAKAVLFALEGDIKKSESSFSTLRQTYKSSAQEMIILSWEIFIAQNNQDFKKSVEINQQFIDNYLKLNSTDNDLPYYYLTLAKSYFFEKNFQSADDNLQKAIRFIEQKRQFENPNLSLAFIEVLHDAYRISSGIEQRRGNTDEAFFASETLKARWLRDKIDNAPGKQRVEINSLDKKELFKLSSEWIGNISDQRIQAEILNAERQAVAHRIQAAHSEKPLDIKTFFQTLENSNLKEDTAIISYFFGVDKQLSAFVWQKGSPVQAVNLTVDEKQSELSAENTIGKIKNFSYYKKDAKQLFDKFLAEPLSKLKSKPAHLVIIPDKSLWKLPFQAFSSDGVKFLIESQTISYAPSSSVLLKLINQAAPVRQTLQVFSNSTYSDDRLLFVNTEALNIARLYRVKANLNATANLFTSASDQSDIVHFSMHSKIDQEDPLNSFLAFKTVNNKSGRVTVGDLLSLKLKKGSLAFLASCETNTVLSGEGLVSLAWGMMGAGASTVISAQWEINDRSTNVFTRKFYENYKTGLSSAEAMQKASIEMIGNKSATGNMSDPFYWAAFTLSGDYR